MGDTTQSFLLHAGLYLLTLATVMVGTALHADPIAIRPLAEGCGNALPWLLGGHAVAAGGVLAVKHWRGPGDEGRDSIPPLADPMRYRGLSPPVGSAPSIPSPPAPQTGALKP